MCAASADREAALSKSAVPQVHLITHIERWVLQGGTADQNNMFDQVSSNCMNLKLLGLRRSGHILCFKINHAKCFKVTLVWKILELLLLGLHYMFWVHLSLHFMLCLKLLFLFFYIIHFCFIKYISEERYAEVHEIHCMRKPVNLSSYATFIFIKKEKHVSGRCRNIKLRGGKKILHFPDES